MIRYQYAMTQRPPQPGAMPHDGLREILPGRPAMDELIGHKVYAVLVYDRRLSPQEISDYELWAISRYEPPRVI